MHTSINADLYTIKEIVGRQGSYDMNEQLEYAYIKAGIYTVRESCDMELKVRVCTNLSIQAYIQLKRDLKAKAVVTCIIR